VVVAGELPILLFLLEHWVDLVVVEMDLPEVVLQLLEPLDPEAEEEDAEVPVVLLRIKVVSVVPVSSSSPTHHKTPLLVL
jgi:hypothetical protein